MPRPLAAGRMSLNFRSFFTYLALDRKKGNLAMARIKLSQIAEKIEEWLAHKIKSDIG